MVYVRTVNGVDSEGDAPITRHLIGDVLAAVKSPKEQRLMVLDRFHVTERIATALEEIEPDRNKRAGLFDRWRRRLDVSATAISSAIASMAALAIGLVAPEAFRQSAA